jgi:hypothetical protein
VNDYLLARVPHLVAGDAVGLRSQGARAMGWFATLGAATLLTLFLVGWVGETRAPYAAVALPLLVILAVTAFIFALRGYRDARAALSEDLSRRTDSINRTRGRTCSPVTLAQALRGSLPTECCEDREAIHIVQPLRAQPVSVVWTAGRTWISHGRDVERRWIRRWL